MNLQIRLLLAFVLLMMSSLSLFAQSEKPWSERMVATVMATHPDSIAYVKEKKDARWEYETGVVLEAIEQVWYRTADARYFQYIQHNMDRFVTPDGGLKTYKLTEFNIDHITPGRALLMLAQQTLPGADRYRKAADLLREQLRQQPRTNEGGFWHKKRYPYQMWLDGLYMAEPFYAEYSTLFNEPDNVNDIIDQFVWMERHSRDAKTGLLYHGWDESRQQKWANPQTGQSPNFWSRSMGWYAMALVDVLDYVPLNHPRRAELLAILTRLMPAVVRFQDAKEGCWYQVTDQGSRADNYLEASGTAMFVYALAKGVRMGYLPASLLTAARKGYAGMLKNFISTDASGLVHLEKTVSVSGLGGNPYRDGSYDYYLSEPLRQDDLKGVGPFIMASVEMEIAAENVVGKGKHVAVDTYFNHEFRKGPNGTDEPFHYTWADRKHSGYWWWGNTFRQLGATTVLVPTAPSPTSLKNVDVYIIVDPDTRKETASPNFISETDATHIANWVRAGGTLVLLANDTLNCEHQHLNSLAARFGIQFLPKLRNPVQGEQFDQGTIRMPANNAIFPSVSMVYIKELAPLAVQPPAQAAVTDSGDVIVATARVGKGTVLAIGDPWLYNEYVDGRRIGPKFQNVKAGKDLAVWLLKQAR